MQSKAAFLNFPSSTLVILLSEVGSLDLGSLSALLAQSRVLLRLIAEGDLHGKSEGIGVSRFATKRGTY